MSRKIRKSGQKKPRNKLLASPTPELIAALSLLGVSLRVTDVALAEEPVSASVRVKLAETYKPTAPSQTNTWKEKNTATQSDSIKLNSTIKESTTIKQTNTRKPGTPQSNAIKGNPAPTVNKQP